MIEPVLKISSAAAILGVSTSTLRAYEELGRIPQPKRSLGNQRVYTWPDLEKLRATLIPAARD